MKILALNSNFEPIRYLPFINLQWNRQYYEAGTFAVQILASDYENDMAYIYAPERPEVGIVQKATLTESVQGRFVEIEGQFLEALLNDKVIFPTYYGQGEIGAILNQMVQTYKDDIPKLNVETSRAKGETIAMQVTGGKLGNTIYETLQTQEMSFRCQYDYQRDKISFYIYQGKDRTQSQTENSFVVFSDGFKNLKNTQASWDESNYKNYAIVAGSGENEERITATVDLSGGAYKRQLYIDARDLQYDAEKQTAEQYRASLVQRGLEKLLKYQVINNIDITTTDNGFIYGTDYDLGDKVDVIIDDLGVDIEARIVTVYEVWKQNQHTVELELGNKKINILDKRRLS